ncbi:MAG: hypothetical protein HY868_21920 [Chloroflexi bacterium]|nr:hypothetical protein [Chloroflexota bacterium]
MDEQVLTEYIIDQLGRHVTRNDLIFDICQRTGLPWSQVSDLVTQVERKDQKKIALKQSPVLLLIAVGILIGGVFFACGALMYFVDLARANKFNLDPFSLRRDYFNVIRLFTGLAMILGSLFGVGSWFKTILK